LESSRAIGEALSMKHAAGASVRREAGDHEAV
jgi:hypothetical protein